MPDFQFHGAGKVIVEPAGAGDTQFDVARDIYSAWKRWVLAGNGECLPAFQMEGGTPIGTTGLYTGTTFIMLNGWRIRPAEHDHNLTLIGNLFAGDGVLSVPTLGNFTTHVSTVTSTQAQGIETGSGLSQPQADQLGRLEKLARNKAITDPATGKMTVYDDDGITPMVEGDVFEDAAGTQPYSGSGIERRDRLQDVP